MRWLLATGVITIARSTTTTAAVAIVTIVATMTVHMRCGAIIAGRCRWHTAGGICGYHCVRVGRGFATDIVTCSHRRSAGSSVRRRP